MRGGMQLMQKRVCIGGDFLPPAFRSETLSQRRTGTKKRIAPALLLTLALIASPGCSSDVKQGKADAKPAAQASAGKKVTFVELGSVRCIPCKMMQPIMKAVEEEYGGRVEVVFHDVWTEEGKPFAEKYRIRVIPTQVFLNQDGQEFFRHEGYYPKEEIVKLLKTQGVEQ
jgi:thioredoxin 1